MPTERATFSWFLNIATRTRRKKKKRRNSVLARGYADLKTAAFLLPPHRVDLSSAVKFRKSSFLRPPSGAPFLRDCNGSLVTGVRPPWSEKGLGVGLRVALVSMSVTEHTCVEIRPKNKKQIGHFNSFEWPVWLRQGGKGAKWCDSLPVDMMGMPYGREIRM